MFEERRVTGEDEDEEDDDALYALNLAELPDADAARRAVAALTVRVGEGRRVHPDVLHLLVVESPGRVAEGVQAVLFPALDEVFDAVSVRGSPSWRVEPPPPVTPLGLDAVRAAFASGTPLSGVVHSVVPDGVLVDLGPLAWLPESQIDLAPATDLDDLVGRRLEVVVVRCDPDEWVVSRRSLLQARRDARAAEVLPLVRPGAVLPGTVCGIMEYGALIDLGGVTGLVHAVDLVKAHGRGPLELLAYGDRVTVEVLDYDAATGRLGLTLRP